MRPLYDSFGIMLRGKLNRFLDRSFNVQPHLNVYRYVPRVICAPTRLLGQSTWTIYSHRAANNCSFDLKAREIAEISHALGFSTI